MKKFLCCLVALCALTAPAFCQDINLFLKGDIISVKVDKLIKVQEDRSVVRSFPFDVEIQGVKGFFNWGIPDGVKAVRKGPVLQVTAAPKGELTITVEVQSGKIVGGDIEYVTRTGSLTFFVGDVGPPPAPTPVVPDPPLSPLQKSLQDAYQRDVDADKALRVAEFADILQNCVTAAAKTGKMKSIKDFAVSTKNATDIALGDGDPKLGATKIPNVRAAVGVYLVSVLPREAQTPFDDAYISVADTEHKRVASALKGVK